MLVARPPASVISAASSCSGPSATSKSGCSARSPLTACDTQADMRDAACSYLVLETTTFRRSLDLSSPADYEVISTWYCVHPFHGIRLESGVARAELERHCAACTLPQPQSNEHER